MARDLPLATHLLDVLLDGVEGLLLADLHLGLGQRDQAAEGQRPGAAKHSRRRQGRLTLVQRGTSTIMLRMVLDSSANRGMSLPGERAVGGCQRRASGLEQMERVADALEGRDDLVVLLNEDAVL